MVEASEAATLSHACFCKLASKLRLRRPREALKALLTTLTEIASLSVVSTGSFPKPSLHT